MSWVGDAASLLMTEEHIRLQNQGFSSIVVKFYDWLLHYPVCDEEEQETWHAAAVFDSVYYRIRACDLVDLNHVVLKIIMQGFGHLNQLFFYWGGGVLGCLRVPIRMFFHKMDVHDGIVLVGLLQDILGLPWTFSMVLEIEEIHHRYRKKAKPGWKTHEKQKRREEKFQCVRQGISNHDFSSSIPLKGMIDT